MEQTFSMQPDGLIPAAQFLQREQPARKASSSRWIAVALGGAWLLLAGSIYHAYKQNTVAGTGQPPASAHWISGTSEGSVRPGHAE